MLGVNAVQVNRLAVEEGELAIAEQGEKAGGEGRPTPAT